MSITFKCPKCGSLCGFADKYAGRKARCLNCNSHFTIPERGGNAKIIEKRQDEPLPGFYRRCLVDNWKIFIDPSNAKGFIFVAFMVALEYFIGFLDFSFNAVSQERAGYRVQLPVGIITVFIVRGCLFWYYFEIIGSTAFEEEKLPASEIGFGFEFLWNIIKSTYLFAAAFLIVQIPYIFITGALEAIQIPLPAFVTVPLLIPGALLFPVAILTIAAGREIWMVFHFGYLVKPVIKAFGPYLTVAGITAAATLLEWTVTYATIGGYLGILETKGQFAALAGLIACITARIPVIAAMRAIGLFGLHYSCYMPQTTVEQ